MNTQSDQVTIRIACPRTVTARDVWYFGPALAAQILRQLVDQGALPLIDRATPGQSRAIYAEAVGCFEPLDAGDGTAAPIPIIEGDWIVSVEPAADSTVIRIERRDQEGRQ